MRFLFTFLLVIVFFQAFSQRNCATMDEHALQLQQNPALQQQLQQIEEHNQHYHEQLPGLVGFREVVVIPVVFHIIHNGDPVGANENLAESFILAQLAQLNDDMRKLNADQNLIPSFFQNLHADTEIQFCLAQRRPDGTATNGINRVQYAQATWTSSQVNSTIKPATIWDRNQYLNVWTVVFGGSSSGILGYAQFPGGSASTDGVVVASNTVGSLLLPNPGSTNYGRGRTLTHEVGHWLNLRHIWGDATCGNDFVDDTPVHNTSNAGCPVFPHYSTCSGNPVEMTMNYMDYTYDVCMQMFTLGQKTRMQAVLSPGGARFSLLSSLGCVPPSTSCIAPTVAQINATNITASTAQLSCTVSGVSAYDWRYRIVGTTVWIDLNATTGNFTGLSALNASTTYEFQTMVLCGTVWSSWSPSKTFTTLAATCNAPLLSQISGSNIGTNSARLNCSVSGVNAYDWRYRQSGLTTWTDVAATANNFIDLTGLLPSTTYEFQASVQCGTIWSSWSASQTFTTLTQPCNAPVIAQISASNIGINTARLNCSVGGVNAYDWRYRQSGVTTWTDLAASTNNFVDISALSASTTYEFQVSVQCGTVWSGWSSSQLFTTLSQPCNAPNPDQISTSNLGNSSVRLNCAVTGVGAYDWRYRLSGSNTWIDLASTTTPFTDVDGLNPGSTYEYQVSVQCVNNWSAWSSTAFFTTLQGSNCELPYSWLISVSDISSQSAVFTYAINNFQGYRWRYKEFSSSTWITSGIQSVAFLQVTGLTAGVQYVVEVSLQCSNGSWSDWSQNKRFQTLPPPCMAPEDHQISALDISVSSAQLNCSMTGVLSFDWRYRTLGSNTWIDLPEGPNHFYSLNLLASATTYEFQVAVLCPSAWSGWSNIKTFTTAGSTCDAPSSAELSATQITDTNARLSCISSQGITFYWRYRPVGLSQWTSTAPTSLNFVELSNLIPGTVYEFQVNIQCTGNTTGWSESQTFTTLNPCLAPAAQTLSVSEITPVSVRLNCSANSSGSFFWRYRQVGAASWISPGATPTGTINLSGLIPATSYEFQVSTQCGAAEGPWSVSLNFSTGTADCNPPYPQSFNATNITAFTARFESYLAGVTQYDWRYRPEGTNTWIDLPESAASSIDVAGLEAATTYEFQSSVQCGPTWSFWSFQKVFTTLPNPCGAPTNSDMFVTQITPTSVRINNAIPNADAYHWKYRPSASQSWITLPSGTVNYYDLNNLNPGTGYEFQAAVSCGALISPWSPSRRFLTPQVTRQETESGLNLKVWPVPAREEVFVSFHLKESATAVLSLLDTTGKLIRSRSIGSNQTGVQAYTLDLRDLPAGMYILKLRSGKITETEKLVIFAE